MGFRYPDEKFEKDCIGGDKNDAKVSQMMWGYFIGGIQGSLIPIYGDPDAARGGVTAKSYIKVLEEGLPAFLDELGERKDFLFMQDNAPIHGAHIVRDWFKEQDIQVMEWPPYSLNLNLIENIWAVLTRKLYK